jgi:catalase
MSENRMMSHAAGAPIVDNLNTMTAGPRGPALLQDIWLIEKLAHFDREACHHHWLAPRSRQILQLQPLRAAFKTEP